MKLIIGVTTVWITQSRHTAPTDQVGDDPLDNCDGARDMAALPGVGALTLS